MKLSFNYVDRPTGYHLDGMNATRNLSRTFANHEHFFQLTRKQNRRQDVVNRGALRSCSGGLTFKFNKNSTNL